MKRKNILFPNSKVVDTEKEWVGMPEFTQENKWEYQSIIVRFNDEINAKKFAKLINQTITRRTKSIWFPKVNQDVKTKTIGMNSNRIYVNKKETNSKDTIPKYPIYIVSKGRWKSRLTSKSLEYMNVDYKIVVEKSEYKKYSKVINKKKILVLPQSFLDEYDTCDDLGNSKSKGPGAARNFCWEHSIKQGFRMHWVMDDNLDSFYRLNKNMKIKAMTGTIFRCAEIFVNRYKNINLSGFNYDKFCKSRDRLPPYVLNTRIYSCLLIKNNISYRWRGRYNEDTDLSLRILKDGFCTIQFNAFLCGKIATQIMKGGNTKEFYSKEGTINKTLMLQRLHPNLTEVVWRFNRWHHQVCYRYFKKNRLIKKKRFKDIQGINNYGMELKYIEG